jgi:ABC-type oligopeptide transport system substrate-binding subunit
MQRRAWLSVGAAAIGLGLLGAAAAHATQPAQAPGTRVEVRPTLTLHYLALNHRGRLFRNNPQLARALNYAIDRSALIRAHGLAAGTATDRLLPYHVPGRSRSRIYPLQAPDVERARALARGHRRSGKAVIGAGYFRGRIRPGTVDAIRAAFQVLGIEPVVEDLERPFHPENASYYDLDVVAYSSTPDLADPRQYVEVGWQNPFSAQRDPTPEPNFDVSVWNRRFAQAAALHGRQRARAYDRLDRDLMRQAPPVVPYMVRNARFVVANRVGCFTYHAAYGVDLAAACLR